jgi:DNA replication protein DnaC
MKYEEFIRSSGIGRDVSKASLDESCLLDPRLIEWGKSWLIGKDKPSLILQGNPGCGKTFFSVALLKALWTQLQPHPFIIFKVSSQLDHQLLNASMGKGDPDSIIRMCSESTVLFLDDLGIETSSERVQRQYFEIFSARYSNNRTTVLSTNCSVLQLHDKFGPRIYSRLKSYKLIKFPEVDFREKFSKVLCN